MSSEAYDVVRQRLIGFSNKGIFKGLRETQGRLGKVTFSFRWLLDSEFSLVLDPKKQQLVVSDLLPAIEHRSFIDSDLRRFIAGRTDTNLPAHRRLDTDLVTLVYSNRNQNVSLVMRTGTGQYEYAIKALLTTLNDLFAHLHLNHVEYLQRHFGVPEE